MCVKDICMVPLSQVDFFCARLEMAGVFCHEIEMAGRTLRNRGSNSILGVACEIPSLNNHGNHEDPF